MKNYSIILAFLLPIVLVQAHSETVGGSSPKLSLPVYLAIVLFISLIITLFLYVLYKNQGEYKSLPMKKIAIVTAITIIMNAIVFGILYVEV